MMKRFNIFVSNIVCLSFIGNLSGRYFLVKIVKINGHWDVENTNIFFSSDGLSKAVHASKWGNCSKIYFLPFLI